MANVLRTRKGNGVDALSDLVGGINGIQLHSSADSDTDITFDLSPPEAPQYTSKSNDPRIRIPTPVSVGRRRGRQRPAAAPKPKPRPLPSPLRTILVWVAVGLMLPLLSGASLQMRGVVAMACLVRYIALFIGIMRVLMRCISPPPPPESPRNPPSRLTRFPPPRPTVLVWEQWAPRAGRRAIATLLASALLVVTSDIVARVTIDIARQFEEAAVHQV